MTHIKDIYLLVKSLSEIEVDQFRLYAASAYDGITPNMVSLFEALLDESTEQTGHFERIQVMPEVRKKLFDHLLRFLRYFQDELDVSFQIGNKIRESKLLYEKCLTEKADSMVDEAVELAIHFEQFYELLQLLNMQKSQLHRITGLSASHDARLKLELLEQEGMLKLQNYIDYRNKSKEISEVYRLPEKIDKKTRLDKLSGIFASPLLNDESKALSLTAKYYFHHERSTYFYYLGDVQKAWESNGKLLDLLREKPFLIDLSVLSFIVTFFNNLIFNLELEHYVEFEERLKEFKRIPETMNKFNSMQFKKLIFERAGFLELKKLICLGEFEKGIERIPDVSAEMELYGELLDSYFRAQFYFIFAYFLFIEERFEESKAWVLKIMELEEFRDDIQVNARIFLHILEFEQQDEEAFRNNLPGTVAFLEKSNRLMITEQAVIKTLQKVIGCEKTLTVKNAFNRLREELLEVGDDAFEKNHLSSFDYVAWLDAKAGSGPYRNAFRKRETSHKFRVIR